MNGLISSAKSSTERWEEVAGTPSRRGAQAPQILYLRDVAELLGYRYSYLRLVASDAARLDGALPRSVHDNFPSFRRFGRRWGIYAPHFHRWLQKRVKKAEWQARAEI